MTANREPRHRKRWEEVPPDPGIIPGGIRDRAMRAVQRISSLKRTKYGAIYADPPWSFRNWSAKGTGRNAISHYDCLDFSALAGMGYRMVLYPLTALRVALRSAQETLADILRQGHQRGRVPHMLTRAELYDLLGYTGYEARDRAYFGQS